MIHLPGLPAGEGYIGAIALAVLALVLLLFLTARIRLGARPRFRTLPVFDKLPIEIGNAAESGSSLHIALGSGRLGGQKSLSSLAAVIVLDSLIDAAVAYGTPPIVTVGDPTLLPLVQDVMRRAYEKRGVPERYNPTSVRFIAPEPIVYALGAADLDNHVRVRGDALIGSFDEEAALVTHIADVRGYPRLAALDRPHAIAAVYSSLTSLAIGEELYAGAAPITRFPHHLASLQVQDILRLLLIGAILLKVIGLF
ncbi:MAG: hypothetical protein JW900_08550 [Anaerolineae bacterium]|nr:hypothetical protein [Anaerolineae bacterium]